MPTSPPVLKLSGKLSRREKVNAFLRSIADTPPFDLFFPVAFGITKTHFFPHLIRISFVAETIYIIVMCAWQNLRGCLCSCFVLIPLFVSALVVAHSGIIHCMMKQR